MHLNCSAINPTFVIPIMFSLQLCGHCLRGVDSCFGTQVIVGGDVELDYITLRGVSNILPPHVCNISNNVTKTV